MGRCDENEYHIGEEEEEYNVVGVRERFEVRGATLENICIYRAAFGVISDYPHITLYGPVTRFLP